MKRRIWASLCAFLLATPLAAAPDWAPDRFSILLGSKHIDASGFNEINPGFFATWEDRPLGFSLGAYVNSYERGSLAATAHLPVFQWQGGALDAFAGLAHYPGDGYRFDTRIGGDVVGIGGLNIRHRNVFVQVLPMTANGAKGLVTFGLTWAARR